MNSYEKIYSLITEANRSNPQLDYILKSKENVMSGATRAFRKGATKAKKTGRGNKGEDLINTLPKKFPAMMRRGRKARGKSTIQNEGTGFRRKFLRQASRDDDITSTEAGTIDAAMYAKAQGDKKGAKKLSKKVAKKIAIRRQKSVTETRASKKTQAAAERSERRRKLPLKDQGRVSKGALPATSNYSGKIRMRDRMAYDKQQSQKREADQQTKKFTSGTLRQRRGK
tara:strand:+ start:628 stop:1308 length:681 start_codon:yes stop_codon:yes gene_type:complete